MSSTLYSPCGASTALMSPSFTWNLCEVNGVKLPDGLDGVVVDVGHEARTQTSPPTLIL